MSTVDPLNVRQVITDDQYGTRLTPLPADVLPRIARALAQIPGGLNEFLILGLNESPDGRRRGLAIDHIVTAARDARIDWDDVLGIDLTPAQAAVVADQLVETTLEPAECAVTRCTHFAEPGTEFCVECQARLADPWMTGVA